MGATRTQDDPAEAPRDAGRASRWRSLSSRSSSLSGRRPAAASSSLDAATHRRLPRRRRARPWRGPAPRSSPRAPSTASTPPSSSRSPAPSRASGSTSTRSTATRRPTTPSTGSTPRRGPAPTSARWDEAIAARGRGHRRRPLLRQRPVLGRRRSVRGTAPTAPANWLTNVTLFMERLGGDPLDTRWTGAGPPADGRRCSSSTGRVERLGGRRTSSARPSRRASRVANTGDRGDRGGGRAARRPRRRRRGARPGAPGLLALAPGERREFVRLVEPDDARALERLDRAAVRRAAAPARRRRARSTFGARLPRDPELRRWVLAELALSGSD